MDAIEKEKLVLKRSILGLGNITVREERLFEQTKRDVRYCGARFLHALNTSTALLNVRFCLSGSTRTQAPYLSFCCYEWIGQHQLCSSPVKRVKLFLI